MERISVFDMFKIGVGPSSSHTMGPWRAAQRFVEQLRSNLSGQLTRLEVHLYGSLAKTGKGHGTHLAIPLGLLGEDPETVDVETILPTVESIRQAKRIELPGYGAVSFDPDRDIVFHRDQTLPEHPNAMRFVAWNDSDDRFEAEYYSIGGGFILAKGEPAQPEDASLPYSFTTATELVELCDRDGICISEIVLRNELASRSEAEIRERLTRIRDVMYDCIVRGCRREGVLPGGLQVRRRAPTIAKRLLQRECPSEPRQLIRMVQAQPSDFSTVLDWVTCFALAVNEENASFGRVVTAPTNGAAGVIPSVMAYSECFCSASEEMFVSFLLTASAIGYLFKKGATISAAQGGCQAEIGVSSSMAAGALTEILGGNPAQVTEAAEIAMEHHLGMTCDPVGGLVQIPCIERNAMGAIKAIAAAQMALQRDPKDARVSLDDVIHTMWQTAQDMSEKYKETSEGGLAAQIPVNVSEC